ncbi:MAG TPA: maleylacetate reductase, partial [Actinomycetota bacterium]|nr:maleylacetate reductase [Actinomycetota bacterium]
VPAEMARVAAALGVADAAGGLWDLARRLGAPAGLAELGLAEAELDRVAELAAAKLGDARGPHGERELRTLLDDAWRGRRPQ